MEKNKLYQAIAQKLAAMDNCQKSGNDEWFDRHYDDIKKLVSDHMPSGSGIDCGTKIDFDKSTDNKLVFYTSYHHMNDGGYYDGWTEHTITVKPSLAFGIELSISGRNRNDIKDYLHEVYHAALTDEVD